MSDQLSRFRRKDLPAQATSADPRGKNAIDAYLPYEISAHPPERMHIIRLDGTMHYPSYRYLMDIVHIADNKGILLVYSFLMVKITGENLEELLEHLSRGDCTFIQKFDSRAWVMPGPGKPIITEIEVVVRQGSDEEKMMRSMEEDSTKY